MKKEIKERIEMINKGEVPEGYKKSKLGIIPEAWEIKKLAKFIDFKGGYAFSSKKMLKTDGKYQLIKMSNVYKNKLSLDRNPSFWNDTSSTEANYLLEKGDIVLTLTGTVGKRDYGYSVMIDKNNKYLLNQRLARLRSKKNLSFYKYLDYFVSSERFLYSFFSISKGGTGNQSNVSIKALREVRTYLPDVKEQNRIANILSTWDKAIELKEKLLEKKKDIKKGLMQRLLTGEIRLDGFDDEWKEVRIKDIGNLVNGLRSKTKEDFGKGMPYVSYKNVFNNNCITALEYEKVLIEENENQNELFYGDILFTTSSETIKEISMSSVFLDNRVNPVYLNSFCFALRPNSFDIINPRFAVYFFRSNNFRKIVMKIGQGSTRQNMSKKYFKKIKIILPTDINEQKSIAEILSKSDKSIELLEKEIKLLREQKKGLMQLLLTGKVRVNELN